MHGIDFMVLCWYDDDQASTKIRVYVISNLYPVGYK